MDQKEVKQINALHFGILSAEEIEANSVVEVTKAKINDTMEHTVYDYRMGVMEMNMTCPTCGGDSRSCPGHFGHIKLSVPIVHPLHYKFVLALMKVICHKCSRFLLNEEYLNLHGMLKQNGIIRFKKIVNRVEKSKICLHCLSTQPKFTFAPTENCFFMTHKQHNNKIQIGANEISKRFENISDEEVKLIGFDPKKMHPRNLIIWNLPVLPPVDRPYVVAEGMTCDDDLTIQYIEIIKINAHLSNPQTAQNKRQKYFQSLKFRIKCLFDNSQNKAKHTNGRPFKCIKKRISGKEGQVRGNLMGKRVEQAARTVIGPDPTLRYGVLGIPTKVAETLTIDEHVNRYNITKMQKLVDNDKCNIVMRGKSRINLKYATRSKGTRLMRGDVLKRNGKKINVINTQMKLFQSDEIFRDGAQIPTVLPKRRKFTVQVGDKIERQLQDGDLALLNRQPTLHEGSMMAHEIKILPNKTFRFNLAATSSFNADFDGDEMNIHIPQSYTTRAELKELSHASKLLVSAQSSKTNVKIVQDSLLGNYLMTRKSLLVPKHQFFNICGKGVDWTSEFILKKIRYISKILKKYGKDPNPYTGRGLFSMMLPEDLLYTKKTNKNKTEPIVKIREGVLIEGTISKADLGGGHSSLIRIVIKEYPADVYLKFIDNLQFISNAWLIYHGFSISIKDCIASKTEEISHAINKCFIEASVAEKTTANPFVREAKVNEALSRARDIGMKLAKDALDENNNFIATVSSGSKGDFFNIAQIAGLLGQQNFSGQRIKPSLNKGRRSIVHYNFGELSQEDSYESKGFVKNSFIRGLSPREMWFHAITGREGVTDTSMKTSRTGYIQRKLVKMAEDLNVQYDMSVRNTNGSVVQFVYGNDGLDGSETIVKNDEPQYCNIHRIVNRLNLIHEKETDTHNKWAGLVAKLLDMNKESEDESEEESEEDESEEESEEDEIEEDESEEDESEEESEDESEEESEDESEEDEIYNYEIELLE